MRGDVRYRDVTGTIGLGDKTSDSGHYLLFMLKVAKVIRCMYEQDSLISQTLLSQRPVLSKSYRR